MTDHEKSARRQEQAALYALGALGDEDARALELELAGSASLKSDIEAFQEPPTAEAGQQIARGEHHEQRSQGIEREMEGGPH